MNRFRAVVSDSSSSRRARPSACRQPRPEARSQHDGRGPWRQRERGTRGVRDGQPAEEPEVRRRPQGEKDRYRAPLPAPCGQVDTASERARRRAGEIPDGPIVEIAAEAPKSKYGPKHHRKTCETRPTMSSTSSRCVAGFPYPLRSLSSRARPPVWRMVLGGEIGRADRRDRRGGPEIEVRAKAPPKDLRRGPR